MICAAILVGIVCAQAESISVEDVAMDKGETKTVAISLTNSHTDLVSFQMDLYLPDGIILNKTGCSLSDRFGSSYELTIGKQSDGAYRLTSTSFSLTPISGTSGTIITLSLTASQTAMVTTASIQNIRLVTSNSERITTANTSFGVTIRDDQTLSLTSLPSQTYGDTYTLPSQTDQGLTLTWTVASSAVAAVSGDVLTTMGVGTTTVTATQAGNNNYRPFTKDYTLTVNKAPLTITANSYTKKQGDAMPEFEATYDGFRNGETESVLNTLPAFTCSADEASPPGTYDIKVGGAEAQNYEITYAKGTLTVTDADPVTVTANSYTIKYGDDIPTLEFTSDGATLNGTPALSCEATSASPVGTYPITVTKGSVENYNVTYVTGTLTIEKAPLTITAQNYTIVQGEAFPEFEATYDGFKNGETEDVLTRKPSLATLADEYSVPGEYEILVAGARANNYEITYVNGVLTIEEPQTGITTFIAKIPDSSVVLRSSNGEITVEGLADGQRVSIHTYGGMLIGSDTAVDGKATINTSLTPGSIVIVKVGTKAIKFVVR